MSTSSKINHNKTTKNAENEIQERVNVLQKIVYETLKQVNDTINKENDVEIKEKLVLQFAITFKKVLKKCNRMVNTLLDRDSNILYTRKTKSIHTHAIDCEEEHELSSEKKLIQLFPNSELFFESGDVIKEQTGNNASSIQKSKSESDSSRDDYNQLLSKLYIVLISKGLITKQDLIATGLDVSPNSLLHNFLIKMENCCE